MVTMLAAVSGVALGALAALGAARWTRARSSRRVAPVRARVDEHVAAIGETLDRVAARVAEVGGRRRDELELSLDLDALLEQVVARAATLTGAQAVAIRVEGPGGEPVVASFGTSDGIGLLDTALGPPDERPFRALTINWTYGPAAEEAEDAFSSALVVPVVESGASTGALVAYAGRSGAFESEHLRALRALADEAAPQIANARRFAELGRRSLTDPLTGVRNRSGYELELEREVARAHRTGRPLSLLLISLEDTQEDGGVDAGGPGSGADEQAVQELATLLARTVRATDIPCRRRERELAVVLPETKDDGARRLWARLHRETATASFAKASRTVSVGLVEWRPDETSDALDARAAAAVGRTRLELGHGEDPVATAVAFGRARGGANAPAAGDLEDRFREHVASAIADARRLGHTLSVAAVEVDLSRVDEEHGLEAADELRAHVAARVEDALEQGSVVSRVDRDRYAILVPHAAAGEAESMLAVLQASLDVRPPGLEAGTVSVSAGIAQLAPGDDAATLLERAEAALRQALAGGPGTVVVAGTGG